MTFDPKKAAAQSLAARAADQAAEQGAAKLAEIDRKIADLAGLFSEKTEIAVSVRLSVSVMEALKEEYGETTPPMGELFSDVLNEGIMSRINARRAHRGDAILLTPKAAIGLQAELVSARLVAQGLSKQEADASVISRLRKLVDESTKKPATSRLMRAAQDTKAAGGVHSQKPR